MKYDGKPAEKTVNSVSERYGEYERFAASAEIFVQIAAVYPAESEIDDPLGWVRHLKKNSRITAVQLGAKHLFTVRHGVACVCARYRQTCRRLVCVEHELLFGNLSVEIIERTHFTISERFALIAAATSGLFIEYT